MNALLDSIQSCMQSLISPAHRAGTNASNIINKKNRNNMLQNLIMTRVETGSPLLTWMRIAIQFRPKLQEQKHHVLVQD